MKLFDLLTLLS